MIDSLPDKITLISSPIEWWFEIVDENIKPISLQVEDLFELIKGENGLSYLSLHYYLAPKTYYQWMQLEIE
ncbi:hypothetical protein FBU30_001586, partial [Linnemannia zychae]